MSSTFKNNDFNDVVFGRRSVKIYDEQVKISREELTEILEEASSAPSSVNLQPWRFIVIDTEEGKAKLSALASYNQTQVKTSAAVIAVFGDLMPQRHIEEIFSKSVELGYMSQEVKDKQQPMYEGLYDNSTPQKLRDIVLIDAGLVSMQLMLVARAHGYDTNPIGGYDKANIAEAFDLDKERYLPVMLISIGQKAVDGRPSYRLPVEVTTTWK